MSEAVGAGIGTGPSDRAAGAAAEAMGAVAAVQAVAVERVTVRVGSRSSAGRAPVPPRAGRPMAHPAGPLARRTVIAAVAVGLVAGTPLALLEWPWPLVIAGVSVAGGVLHRLARRASFGFGDGFVAFRGDLGRPSGVQEDDDVHWSWR